MVALDTWFAVAGSLASVMQYLAPLNDVLRMRERGSSTGALFLPFLLSGANTFLWTMHGLILRDVFVFVSSLFGLMCSMFFLYTYYVLIRRPSVRERFHKAVAVTASLTAAVLLYIGVLAPRRAAALHMGVICALAALGTVGASGLRLMYPTPSDASSPDDEDSLRTDSNIVVMATIACALWAVYGYLIGDVFVTLVNGAGFAIGAAQMGLSAATRCLGSIGTVVSPSGESADAQPAKTSGRASGRVEPSRPVQV